MADVQTQNALIEAHALARHVLKRTRWRGT